MSAPLKLYVKTWCGWCKAAIRYLQERGYEFEKIDVEADRASWQKMVALSGQSFTPTLEVDGKVLADFGPDELEIFLRQNEINP